MVWSVRHLPDEPRTGGMLLALDAIWRDVDTPAPTRGRRARPTRRLVMVDEAWTLLRDGEGARFLYRLAKAARKRRSGLVVVTQDAEDLLATDLGKAVAANAATQILREGRADEPRRRHRHPPEALAWARLHPVAATAVAVAAVAFPLTASAAPS